MSGFKVGAARREINYPDSLMPYPSIFGGRYNDLYTRAIVIDNGEVRCAIIGYDLSGTPDVAKLKSYIHEKCGIPAEYILVTATHNHCGPMVTTRYFGGGPMGDMRMPAEFAEKIQKYAEIVFDATVDAVNEAIEKLRPARYGFGEGKCYINVNRDRKFEDGYYVQAPNFDGVSDKTLAVMKFVDEADKAIALLVNYAVHPTCGYLQKDRDGIVKFFSDLTGVAAAYVEKRYALEGDDMVTLWTNGAAGDQNPINFFRHVEPDGMPLPGYGVPDGFGYEIGYRYGEHIALDILNVDKHLTCYKTAMPIDFVENTVPVPGQRAPEGVNMSQFHEYADNIFDVKLVGFLPNGDFVIPVDQRPEKHMIDMIPADPVDLPMQLVTLGDVALVGACAELYNAIGLDIKANSPFKNTMVVTYTGASLGYIVDKDMEFSKMRTTFGAVRGGAEAQQAIVDNVKTLFQLHYGK